MEFQVLKELIKIDTQNPGTDYIRIGLYLENKLAERGAKVVKIGKNIVGIWGKPTLLLNAHMDTVKAQNWKVKFLKAVKIKGKIYGLGTCDTKGSIYCILTATKRPPKNLAVLFSTDEELGAHPGSEEFVKSFEAKGIERAVVMEPTENKIVTSHPGYYEVTLIFSGEQTHSSVKGKSAVEKCLKSIGRMKKNFSNLNIGEIKSESLANIASSQCTTRLSIRSYKPFSKIANKLKKATPRGTKIIWNQIGESFSNQNPFLMSKLKVDYWTEASVLQKNKINTVVYGPGSIKQAHTPGEFVEVASLKKCIKFLEGLIAKNE